MADGTTPNPKASPPERKPAEHIKAAAQGALKVQAELAEQRDNLEVRETVEKALESGRFAMLIFYISDDNKDTKPLKYEQRIRNFPREDYQFIGEVVGNLVTRELSPPNPEPKDDEQQQQ